MRLSCREVTNRAPSFPGTSESLGLGWLRPDKLKHIGHKAGDRFA